MNIILKFAVLIYPAIGLLPLNADDSSTIRRGEAVLLNVTPSAVEISLTDPRMGPIISRVVITSTLGSSPPSYFISGQVVSDNTGTGLERVPICIGRDSQVPVLAAMSNADGDFKFRLWIKTDNSAPKISVPQDFSGYLYVGGYLSVPNSNGIRLRDGTVLQSATPQNDVQLTSGYVIRYNLNEFAVRSGIKLPVPDRQESIPFQKAKK